MKKYFLSSIALILAVTCVAITAENKKEGGYKWFTYVGVRDLEFGDPADLLDALTPLNYELQYPSPNCVSELESKICSIYTLSDGGSPELPVFLGSLTILKLYNYFSAIAPSVDPYFIAEKE